MTHANQHSLSQIQNLQKRGVRFLSLAGALCGILLLADIQAAQAELPTDGTCRYRVNRRAGRRLDAAVHRFTFVLNTILGLGETCSVTHQVCGSRFIPVSSQPNNDRRRCIDFTEVGISNLGAGDSRVVARSRSRVIAQTRRGGSRQLTYGTTVTCTDGEEETSFQCEPKARKLSVNGAAGTSISRAVRQVTRNFSG
ncbi:hypothetical protein MRY87_09155 [bacterium]|nr:hypothetical protein [bacterium]